MVVSPLWVRISIRGGGGCNKYPIKSRGRRGRDHMVVGFTTTYAISDVVSSNLDQGEVYNIMW
jgi:hypothetical protein